MHCWIGICPYWNKFGTALIGIKLFFSGLACGGLPTMQIMSRNLLRMYFEVSTDHLFHGNEGLLRWIFHMDGWLEAVLTTNYLRSQAWKGASPMICGIYSSQFSVFLDLLRMVLTFGLEYVQGSGTSLCDCVFIESPGILKSEFPVYKPKHWILSSSCSPKKSFLVTVDPYV